MIETLLSLIRLMMHNPCKLWVTLQWHHNGCDNVSNHQPHDCVLNRLFGRRSKKTSKLRVTGLCAGNSPGTGEFPAQMASNAENVSIWWRHHESKSKPYAYFIAYTQAICIMYSDLCLVATSLESLLILIYIFIIFHGWHLWISMSAWKYGGKSWYFVAISKSFTLKILTVCEIVLFAVIIIACK